MLTSLDGLALPAFVAGILTFLAPCTLPLVPGYLAFIGGGGSDATTAAAKRRRVFLNGVFYVVGFSAVFILLGSLFGLGGAVFIQYRIWLSRIGGIVVIFFGLVMLGTFRHIRFFSFLQQTKRFPLLHTLTPGYPASSFLFGATFAFGWTPCIGPILASVLLLASSSATLPAGALLLAIFSLGLALPFLGLALLVGRTASSAARNLARWARLTERIGGILLVILGVLLLTQNFGLWTTTLFRLLRVFNYAAIQQYL